MTGFSGLRENLRELALQALSEYGGKLIEIPYTKGISSTAILKNQLEIGTTPDVRRASLKDYYQQKN